ncbi:MAG TPA: hypothetical protein VGW38_23510 [Chloroflexota bacterium]|nr:hypothetical protein [Chloroflexota bacterium]
MVVHFILDSPGEGLLLLPLGLGTAAPCGAVAEARGIAERPDASAPVSASAAFPHSPRTVKRGGGLGKDGAKGKIMRVRVPGQRMHPRGVCEASNLLSL